MICADEFMENFKAEWEHTIATCQDAGLLRQISDTEANKEQRTKFMLEKGGFLHRVMKRLPKHFDLNYQTEIYTFDALICHGGGQKQIQNSNLNRLCACNSRLKWQPS